MSFDKFLNKAKNLANDPKVREHLKSDKAERVSDSFLDKAAGAADSLTKGKHRDRIQKARDAADRAVGTDGPGHTDGEGRTDGPGDGSRESPRDPRSQGPGEEPHDPRGNPGDPRPY